MSRRADEYARRRAALQLQCVDQRQQLAAATDAIQARLQAVDRRLAAFRKFRVSPLWLAGGAALALTLGSGRVLRLMQLAGRIGTGVAYVRRLFGRP